MSEYQYYEFQAIDRALTEREMSELRSCSTRACITATRFENDYSYGSFRGNEDAWMDKYFDAFLYLANWGTHVFKLRLPSGALDLETARQYCAGEPASARETGACVVLSFVSDDEEGGDWVEGEGQLSSLIGVRAELACGDLRALYLGWLLSLQEGDLDDDAVEPPVPPGLGERSACLDGMVDSLRIDVDLLDVAANATADPSAPRTVGELRRAAAAHAEERQRVVASKAAEEKARRKRQAAAARLEYLDSVAPRAPQLWGEVEALISTKQPKGYARAIELLVDLRDLSLRSNGADFGSRVHSLRAAHVHKAAFLKRLAKAGL
jgi:hypothetical protein